MENKIKHLEFIQNIIIRLNSNSFIIKGWTITLVSALFALAAKDSNLNFALICYIVIPSFWSIDGFFLSRERKYRILYEEVAAKPETTTNFSLRISHINEETTSWPSGIISKTLIPFYGISVLASVVVIFLLK